MGRDLETGDYIATSAAVQPSRSPFGVNSRETLFTDGKFSVFRFQQRDSEVTCWPESARSGGVCGKVIGQASIAD